MIVKLLTKHHLHVLECLSLEGNYRGSSESTHVKMPHLLEISRTGSIISDLRWYKGGTRRWDASKIDIILL